MKMKLISLLLLVCPVYLSAQVGIGTTSPTATLDVNGTLRIRQSVPNTNNAAAKDSVLVINNQGDVARTTSKAIVNSYIKSFVKGGFSDTSSKSLSISSGSRRIPFDHEDFDINNEYDTSTNTFTAKQAGIYAVYIQIKSTSSLGLAGNFGVGIVKNATNTIISRSSFANVGVAGVNLTPPFRSTQTLVELDKEETIKFFLYCDLLNVGLFGTREDCYFTIYQVR